MSDLQAKQCAYFTRLVNAYSVEHGHGSKKKIIEGIGITRQTLTNWLNGKPIDKRYFPLIGEFFGVSVEAIERGGTENLTGDQSERLEAAVKLVGKIERKYGLFLNDAQRYKLLEAALVLLLKDEPAQAEERLNTMVSLLAEAH